MKRYTWAIITFFVLLTGVWLIHAQDISKTDGTKIKTYYNASASLDWASIAANSCAEKTISLGGVTSGSIVDVGVPTALGATTGLTFTGYVSATGTVTVRACNVATSASADPAAATVIVAVFQ
jgi:hypothetical protein